MKDRINQTLFKILQSVDYIYEVYFSINQFFTLSDFPLDKTVRITKLSIDVRNYNNFSLLVSEWNIEPEIISIDI